MYGYALKWRTIPRIARAALNDVRCGVRNIIRWIPVIWGDQDWDWYFLAKIMEWKLRRMHPVFKHGCHIGSNRDARRILICTELLKRLIADEHIEPITRPNVLRHNQRMSEWQEMLGRYLGKHLREWWD